MYCVVYFDSFLSCHSMLSGRLALSFFTILPWVFLFQLFSRLQLNYFLVCPRNFGIPTYQTCRLIIILIPQPKSAETVECLKSCHPPQTYKLLTFSILVLSCCFAIQNRHQYYFILSVIIFICMFFSLVAHILSQLRHLFWSHLYSS